MKKTILYLFFCILSLSLQGANLWIETESFKNKGGWVVDQQFIDQMGSSYLMAHGKGTPVQNASTTVRLPQKGHYYVYARTYNWTSPFYSGKGPGAFHVKVNDKVIGNVVGNTGNSWEWQLVGKIKIDSPDIEIALQDLTGFNGRCDALYFTTDSKDTSYQERKMTKAKSTKKFDFVVIGGGLAGMCAAVSAARQGIKVALVHDRPILGGNNSSEVRVHLGGHIELEPYVNLGNLLKEFASTKWGNAQKKENYEDDKKHNLVEAEKNITLFLAYRATDVKMKSKDCIAAVEIIHIENGEKIKLEAPLFADCTGDGNLGASAGADFCMGRESKSEYNEPRAPEVADKMTMGASVQWNTKTGEKTTFPMFNYGITFTEETAEKVTMGEWTWETGMNRDQIADAEKIRDYGLLVVYSNWSFLKNTYSKKNKYEKKELDWVAYIVGKRESRRLMGDYVLTENDLNERKIYPDGTASTSWTIDLHYPDPKNTKHFPGKEFLSIAEHTKIYPYPVPYRCLYSRNIKNMFMAGRNISVTHVALGTVRVMRTTAMLGEVVGMAASVCNKRQCLPRQVYENYFPDLKLLMEKGAGKTGLPNNQLYNEGNRLWK